jgi:putative oxidoreductase
MEVLYAHLVESLRRKLEALEARVVPWLACYSVMILRVGLGSIFLGFGLLKFFPGFSPAEGLVMQTLGVLSFGLVPVRVGVVLVAALECAIGLGLITGRFLRPSLALLGFQMIGAMSPLVLFPGELFSGPFYAPTLEGQYVLKDVVLISAGLVIGTTLQGGRLASDHAHRSVAHRGHARNTPSKTTRRQYPDSARFKA